MKEIFLPTEKKKELETVFKTTRPTVWAALKYKTNSSFARMLRAAALERGGVVYGDKKSPSDFSPSCETYFDHVKNTMTQIFSARVKLVANRTTGKTIVFVDDEELASYDNPKMTELGDIQINAQDIATKLT